MPVTRESMVAWGLVLRRLNVFNICLLTMMITKLATRYVKCHLKTNPSTSEFRLEPNKSPSNEFKYNSYDFHEELEKDNW